MALEFRNTRTGTRMVCELGPWAVYLNLAEAHGYRLPGTRRPDDLDISKPWNGAYDIGAGQYVTNDDAFALAQRLSQATRLSTLAEAIRNTLARIDVSVTNAGGSVPEHLKMKPELLIQTIPLMIRFLSGGEFSIHTFEPPEPPTRPSQSEL